jgi:hypothetical protein
LLTLTANCGWEMYQMCGVLPAQRLCAKSFRPSATLKFGRCRSRFPRPRVTLEEGLRWNNVIVYRRQDWASKATKAQAMVESCVRTGKTQTGKSINR